MSRTFWFLGSVALISLSVMAFPLLLRKASGPKAEILGALKASEKDGLSLPVAHSSKPLVSIRHQYQRMQVDLQPSGQKAVVTATLDFTGKWGNVEVSSLGFERIVFELRDGDWVPSKSLAPILVESVELLENRRLAWEEGSLKRLQVLFKGTPAVPAAMAENFLAVKQRQYRVSAWYIRSERDGGTAREEFRFMGTLPQRPVDEKGAISLDWVTEGETPRFIGDLR